MQDNSIARPGQPQTTQLENEVAVPTRHWVLNLTETTVASFLLKNLTETETLKTTK